MAREKRASLQLSLKTTAPSFPARPEPKVEWGWPPPNRAPFPISCRFMKTDQWFRTHVDPSWTVGAIKVHLLQKCGLSVGLGTKPRDERIALSAASPPAQTLPSRLKGKGLASSERSATHSERKSLSVSRMGDLQAVRVTPSSPSSPPYIGEGTRHTTAYFAPERKRSPERELNNEVNTSRGTGRNSVLAADYALYSFSNGYRLRDDYLLLQYHLKSHDLVEIQAIDSYIWLDRLSSYIEACFYCPAELCRVVGNELQTLSLQLLVKCGTVTFWQKDRQDEPESVSSLRSLVILKEKLLFARLDKEPVPYCIVAGFEVPSASTGSSAFETRWGKSINLLLPDPSKHEQLLRIFARAYCENLEVIPQCEPQRPTWRERAYRQAVLHGAPSKNVSDQDSDDSSELSDIETELDTESELEWEGWRSEYESVGILRSRHSLATIRPRPAQGVRRTRATSLSRASGAPYGTQQAHM